MITNCIFLLVNDDFRASSRPRASSQALYTLYILCLFVGFAPSTIISSVNLCFSGLPTYHHAILYNILMNFNVDFLLKNWADWSDAILPPRAYGPSRTRACAVYCHYGSRFLPPARSRSLLSAWIEIRLKYPPHCRSGMGFQGKRHLSCGSIIR